MPNSPAVKPAFFRFTTLLGLTTLLIGCVTEGPRSTLNPAGPIARQLRTTVGAASLENTPENLARWIADPQGVKPGNFMPDLFAEDDPQADEDVKALVAYLESLRRH